MTGDQRSISFKFIFTPNGSFMFVSFYEDFSSSLTSSSCFGCKFEWHNSNISNRFSTIFQVSVKWWHFFPIIVTPNYLSNQLLQTKQPLSKSQLANSCNVSCLYCTALVHMTKVPQHYTCTEYNSQLFFTYFLNVLFSIFIQPHIHKLLNFASALKSSLVKKID